MILLLFAQMLSWTFPCSFDMSRVCESFSMIINEKPSAFIEPKFKNAKDDAMCMGKLAQGSIGSVRYLVNSTAPSSLVGTVFPQKIDPPAEKKDDTGTLEDTGEAIFLYDKKLILGFKATQANWGGAEISWECSL